jgi:hypothetical protein
MYQFDNPYDVVIEGIHKGIFLYWAYKVDINSQAVWVQFNPNIPVKNNTILYAIYQTEGLTVSYDPGEGGWADEIDEAQKALRQDSMKFSIGNATRIRNENDLVPPTLNDQVFIGWAKQGSNDECYYPGTIYPVTGNVTFVAQYLPRSAIVAVEYHANDGSGASRSVNAEQWSSHYTYANPLEAFDVYDEPTDKTFVKWSKNKSEPIGNDESVPAGIDGGTNIDVEDADISLFGLWKLGASQTYTVTYDPGEWGLWDATRETYNGLEYGEPTPSFGGDPYSEGDWEYEFAGWSPEVSPTVEGNVTYYAQWSFIGGGDVWFYDVYYAPGEHGTWYTEANYSYAVYDMTPEYYCDPYTQHDDGWVFTGWSPAIEFWVTHTVTYTAQWAPASTYTVTYDPGAHGTWAAEDHGNLTHGTATPDFEGNYNTQHDNGWTFSHWTPSVAENVTDNATYTATWTQNKYTVTYAPGAHGTWAAEDHDNLTYGINTPDFEGNYNTQRHNGWTFAGWEPSVAENVTDNATYTATWTQNKYTVTYAPGAHGTWAAEDHDNLTYGINTPDFEDNYNTQHDNGWTFSHWTPSVEPTVTGNQTYIAQWTQNKYTVTYDPGAHGTWAAENATYGELVYGDETPTFGGNVLRDRDPGWMFMGWDPSVEELVTDNATYVAQWQPIPYPLIPPMLTSMIDETQNPPPTPESVAEIEDEPEDDNVEIDEDLEATPVPVPTPVPAPINYNTDVPPEPNIPGRILIPKRVDEDDSGELIFIEVDENDTPFGEWRFNKDEGVWVYDEYPPHSEFIPPQTGDVGIAMYMGSFITSILGTAIALNARRRRRK